MHHYQSVQTGGNIVQHDPGALRKRLQLSHRWWLHDVEDTKKYKAGHERFPRERDADQGDQLTRDFINHHKLRIFRSGASRDPGGCGNAK